MALNIAASSSLCMYVCLPSMVTSTLFRPAMLMPPSLSIEMPGVFLSTSIALPPASVLLFPGVNTIFPPSMLTDCDSLSPTTVTESMSKFSRLSTICGIMVSVCR